MAAARVFTDWTPAALQEAGDYLLALEEGAISEEHLLGEVGAVMSGSVPGRTDPGQITIFEALGQAVQDLVTAGHVANLAEATSGKESAA